MPRHEKTMVRACAAFVMLLGLVTVVGWSAGIPHLLRLRPDWTPMVLNTGVGFVLAGIGLWLGSSAAAWSSRGAVVLGFVVALLGIEELLVLLLDIAPALSLPEMHRVLQPGYPHPGRMAPNTAMCFVLFGIGLAAISHSTRTKVRERVHWAAIATLGIGLLGVIGYSLQLEYLYGWVGIVRMAAHTGVGMVVLGFGLRTLAVAEAGPAGFFEGNEATGIYRTAALVMIFIAVSAGIAGFSFLQSRVEAQLHELLQQASQDRAQLFNQIIEYRSARARFAGQDRQLAPMLRALGQDQAGALAHDDIDKYARVLSRNGFSSVIVEAGGRRLQLAGSEVSGSVAAPILGGEQRWLVWEGRYFLRSRTPVRDAGTAVGTLVTEQALDALSLEAASTARLGSTGELALCRAVDVATMDCFPQRLRPYPFRVNRVIGGEPLPMDYALRGLTGSVVALDYRRQRVFAAYTPVGKTSLGLLVKQDVAEIYDPIRKRFQLVLLFLCLLVVAGLLLLHGRLRPLLNTLEATRAQARAAVESNLDAFFIMDCVRDDAGKPIDFRYVLLNERAGKMLRRPRAEVIGQGMFELFPETRTDGMFEKYLGTIESGLAVKEERSALAHDGRMRWYHLQATKLGDGIGVTVRDITRSRAAADAVRYQALHDALTGLPNRACFEIAMEAALAESKVQGHVTGVMLLDLDGFKEINDSLGHATGDQLLQEVARRLQQAVRPGDTVARLGGDEFVIVLSNTSYPEGPMAVGSKCLAQLAAPFKLGASILKITVSIGMCAAPAHGMTSAGLLKCADAAMYAAKRRGRNQYVLAD